MAADPAHDNLAAASALIGGLMAAGLREVVISPGSRSTPLVLACEACARLKSWIQIDERCAAFFALGRARKTERPVALIATSGSAPAHWLPAVIEASHNGIPLILVSADRPRELQGWGANQTTDQTLLFCAHARAVHCLPAANGGAAQLRYFHQSGRRALEESRWPRPGPVHLNMPFHEPLFSAEALPAGNGADPAGRLRSLPQIPPDAAQLRELAQRLNGQPGLIVAGPESGDVSHAAALWRLALALGAPLLADPLSGLRYCEPAEERDPRLCHYDAWLRQAAFAGGCRPRWILRTGAMPVSRVLGEFIDRDEDCFRILLDPQARWRDPGHVADELVIADIGLFCEQLAGLIECPAAADWFEGFALQEQQARTRLAQAGIREAALIQTLLAALPANSTLFSGNSLPVRNLDSFSACGDRPLRLLANRGVSGIDGNVSTLAGLAAENRRGKVVGLIGDLACYHDMNGLLALREQEVLLIVVNNHGGGIFHHLPQAGLPSFERAWQTDTGLDFSRIAALYDLVYEKIASGEPVAEKLAAMLERPGARLLEIEIDAADSAARHRAWWKPAGA